MGPWVLWLREDECGWLDTKAWRQYATLGHLLCRKQTPSRGCLPPPSREARVGDPGG